MVCVWVCLCVRECVRQSETDPSVLPWALCIDASLSVTRRKTWRTTWGRPRRSRSCPSSTAAGRRTATSCCRGTASLERPPPSDQTPGEPPGKPGDWRPGFKAKPFYCLFGFVLLSGGYVAHRKENQRSHLGSPHRCPCIFASCVKTTLPFLPT